MNRDRDNDALCRRLRRIEGQARGVRRMVEADARCVDVLNQISAMTRALESVALVLLDSHLRDCVREAGTGNPSTGNEKAAEASAAIARLVRS